jgi:hypothetical protein
VYAKGNLPADYQPNLGKGFDRSCVDFLGIDYGELVERTKEGGADDRSRATYVFRLCTGRMPDADEVNKLLQFWKEQLDYFEDRTATAASVALANPEKIPADVNLHKVAAWAMVSRAVLNLDETITKE